MSARDQILARVRGAVADVTPPMGSRGPAPRVEQLSAGPAETIDLFVDNVVDYRATVVRAPAGGVASAIGQALAAHAAGSVVVPSGVDPAWLGELPDGITVVADDGLGNAELDAVDAVLTASAVSIATTGTIVLDHGPDQGRRALSLVPDLHVCIVRAEQVVHDVPEAVARLRPNGMARPLTWISGPSATSDIELDRVEGVHGPRTLHVVLVEG